MNITLTDIYIYIYARKILTLLFSKDYINLYFIMAWEVMLHISLQKINQINIKLNAKN